MKKHKFSIKSRIKSFQFAWNGLKLLYKEEHNFRIHLICALVVIILAWLMQLSTLEWLIIILVIAMVFITEVINTTVENFCNFISPSYHLDIKKIKDISAASVLISSIVAVVIGLIIFLPKIF